VRPGPASVDHGRRVTRGGDKATPRRAAGTHDAYGRCGRKNEAPGSYTRTRETEMQKLSNRRSSLQSMFFRIGIELPYEPVSELLRHED
jgi:hypothetical protein